MDTYLLIREIVPCLEIQLFGNVLLGRPVIRLELQDPERRFASLLRNVGIPDDFKFLALKTSGT